MFAVLGDDRVAVAIQPVGAVNAADDEGPSGLGQAINILLDRYLDLAAGLRELVLRRLPVIAGGYIASAERIGEDIRRDHPLPVAGRPTETRTTRLAVGQAASDEARHLWRKVCFDRSLAR